MSAYIMYPHFPTLKTFPMCFINSMQVQTLPKGFSFHNFFAILQIHSMYSDHIHPSSSSLVPLPFMLTPFFVLSNAQCHHVFGSSLSREPRLLSVLDSKSHAISRRQHLSVPTCSDSYSSSIPGVPWALEGLITYSILT